MHPRLACLLVLVSLSGCAVTQDLPLGADKDSGTHDGGDTVDTASADGGPGIDDAPVAETSVEFDSGPGIDDAVADTSVDFDGGPVSDTGVDFDGDPVWDSGVDFDGGPVWDSDFSDVDFDGGPVFDADPGLCDPSECGPPSGAPSCTCGDGMPGCNTGRCLRNFAGTCGWEYRVCPF